MLRQLQTDFLTQRRPSVESVTRLVEAFSQRVSSSPTLSYRHSVGCSLRVYANFFCQKNATVTLATQSALLLTI